MGKTYKINNSENSSLKEITSLFFEIENKIISLNQCSSDDFMELNNLVKANLSLSKTLSENIDLIFNLSGKDENKKLLENILEDFDNLRLNLTELENVFDISIQLFDKLMIYLSRVSVPLSNFNQNLSSLKLLLANLKLTSTCSIRNPDGFNAEESRLIENGIDKVKNVCPVIDENIFNLKNHLEVIQKDLLYLKNMKLPDLISVTQTMQAHIKAIINQTNEGLKEKFETERLIAKQRNDLDNTSTVLKKQDDIRRKVEIFHKTHDNILKELVKVDNKNTKVNDFAYEIDKLQISKISDNQISRILSINDEYQHSVKNITSIITGSKDRIEAILSHSRGLLPELAGKGSAGISDNFGSFNQKLSQFIEKYQKYTEEISIINKVVNELNEKFSDVEMMENAIEQRIVNKIHIGEFLIRTEKEIAGQAQNLFKIYSANHIEKNNLKQMFDRAIESINEIVRVNAVFSFKNGNMHFFESALYNFKKQFDKFNSNCQLIGNVFIETEQQEQQFVINVNNVVKKTKYYGFFDTTVKQVVLLLERINKKMRSDLADKESEYVEKYNNLSESEFVIK